MKIKNVMKLFGLSLFALASAAAVAVGSEEAPAKADADTWMVHFSLKAGDIIGYEGFDASSMYVQTYTDGVGNDRWFHMFPISEGSEYFAVNATFPESYTYNRIQYKFMQGSADKWGTPYSTSGSKESHSKMLYSTFSGSWTGDNWNFSANTYPSIYAEYNDVKYHLEEDPANKRFIASSLVSDESDYYTFLYRADWNFTWDTLTATSKLYCGSSHGQHYAELKAGTYDVILKNDNSDGGIVELKKHKAPTETYIYYVTASNSETIDYIYSWGGTSQFSSFPGTAIKDVTGVKEITSHGVLHFQGIKQEAEEKTFWIYKIPVVIGYPTGDINFMFNNGSDSAKSDECPLVPGAAYWWTGGANVNAGLALDFLDAVETKRNAASGYSVCNISKSDAEDLVDAYNALDAGVISTYIDCTKVYTKNHEGAGDRLYTYEEVMISLAKVAGKPLANHSVDFNTAESSTNAIIIIAAVTSVLTLSIVVMIRVKAKKQKQ